MDFKAPNSDLVENDEARFIGWLILMAYQTV